jgi:subtilisin-like proprotein convertase family protein
MNRATLSDVLRRWAFRIRKSPAVRKPITNSPFVNFLTFEERLAPSTTPIVSETRLLASNTDGFNRFGVVTASDPNDPQRMVMVYGLADANGKSPISTLEVSPGKFEAAYVYEGRFTRDGGNNWTTFNFGTSVNPPNAKNDLPDPNNPNSPIGLQLPFMSSPSIAFARNNRFHVTFTQTNDVNKTHGRLLLYNFDWDQTTNKTPTQSGTQFLRAWMNQDPVFNPIVAINNNIGTYTDPQTGVTVTDPMTNRGTPSGYAADTPSAPIYIAWNSNFTTPTKNGGGVDGPSTKGPTPLDGVYQFDPNMVYIAASSDSGNTFSTPIQVNNGVDINGTILNGFYPRNDVRSGGAQPQIFFSPINGDAGSQGRLFVSWGKTDTPNVNGSKVGVGYDVTNPTNGLVAGAPVVGAFSVSSATNPFGAAFQFPLGKGLPTGTTDTTTVTALGATFGFGNIRDAIEPPTAPPPPPNTPDIIVRTDFTLPVDVSAGIGANKIWTGTSDVTLKIAINSFDVRQFAFKLYDPAGNGSSWLLNSSLKTTDGSYIPDSDFPAPIPFGTGIRSSGAIRTLGAGNTQGANTLTFLPATTFGYGATISDGAARRINDPANLIGKNELIGFYRPENGSITATFAGYTATQMNGDWKLSIYDIRSDRTENPGPRNLYQWGITFTSNLSQRMGTDRVMVDPVTFDPITDLTTGLDFNKNASQNTPLDKGYGIGSGISVASDTSLGSKSLTKGNVYVMSTVGVGTDTDVAISTATVDPTTGSLLFGRFRSRVNNDAASDNVTEGTRTQFMPEITTDPVTGAVVATWYDARFDASNSRFVRMIGTSYDGGATFQQTYLNQPKVATDAITGKVLTLEPIPDNMNSGISGSAAYEFGVGANQSVIAFNGKAFAFWTGNQNSGGAKIFTATTAINSGPRISFGDSGPVTSKLTLTKADFSPFTVNTTAPDGSQLLDGFRLVFDRKIQPGTLNASDVTVIYRSPTQTGLAPTSQVAIGTPFELFDANLGINRAFWVPFLTPQSAIGTYSYAVGAVVRDWQQSTIGSYPNQFPSTDPATSWVVLQPLQVAQPPLIPGLPNPPTTPPAPYHQPLISSTPVVSAGGALSATLTAPSLPAQTGAPWGTWSPVVGEVVVTINMTSPLNNVAVFLEDADGLGISVPLTGGAGNNTNTRFADRGPLAYANGAQPWTGEFRPVGSLASFAGRPLTAATNWRLRIQGNGTLNSWALQILPGRVVDAANPVVGNFMDQNGNGRVLEIPGQFPDSNDLFSNPASTTGRVFQVPYTTDTQPLILAGPRFVATSSPQQLPQIVSLSVSGPNTLDIVFDRRIDPATFNLADIGSITLATPPNTVMTPTAIAQVNATTFRITVPPTVPNGVYLFTFTANADVRTSDNLVYNQPTNNVTVTFDRDMDPTTFTAANVVRMTGPLGDIAGPFTVTPIVGSNRSFRVGFPTQVITGQYNLEFSPTMLASATSVGGSFAVDTNLNAGLQTLRGVDPNAASFTTNTYATTASPVTILPQGVVSLPIDVPDSFVINQLVGSTRANSTLISVRLDINYPNTPDLSADLIAPNGTRIRLFTRTGTSGIPPLSNFTATIFDDIGVSSIQQGTAPFTGIFLPQFPLSSLNGLGALGIGPNAWRIEITNNGNSTGTFNNWGLTLPTTVPGTGLGETTADRFTAGFRIYQNESNNPLSQQVWAPTGPGITTTAILTPFGPSTATQPIAGRANTVAVDPSDSSGNTVYVGGASGGVWKTTNFLTLDPDGPTWTPLTDFGPSNGLNISSITLIPRNNDPNQTIVFAATGSGGSPGTLAPVTDGTGLPQVTGVGLIRSLDGGRTWTVLDSIANGTGIGENVLPIDSGARNRLFFNANIFKVIADPTPTNGQRIMYMAVSGNAAQAGVWRSLDTGLSWTRLATGNATDVALAAGSADPVSGNLTILYAAIQGQGIFFTDQATATTDMQPANGGRGTPLVRNGATNAEILVANNPSPLFSGAGRISLAVPALTNDPLQNSFYSGWVYALVSSGNGDPVSPDPNFPSLNSNLYLSRDFGQNWTRVLLPSNGGFGTNNETRGQFDLFEESVRTPTQLNGQSGVANNALSIAVSPQNPSIVYIGGIAGLRVDTTRVNTPQTFVNFDNSRAAEANATTGATNGGLTRPTNGVSTGLFLPGSSQFTYGRDFLNLRRYPNVQVGNSTATPFDNNATLRVTDPAPFPNPQFSNSGENAVVTPFVNILDAGLQTFSFSDITQIIPVTDPVTGNVRLLFSTRYGIVSGVDTGNVRGTGTLQTSLGFNTLPSNNRNGNLNLQRFYSGAVQPSILAADLAGAMFYGMAQDTGFIASRSGILNNGDLNWNGTVSNASTGVGVATAQTGTGTSYQYRLPCCYNTSLPDTTITPTDFFRVYAPGTSPLSSGTSRTLGLVQSGDSPGAGAGQWPFNRADVGYFAVNPIDPNGMVISSVQGRIFRTVNQGTQWFVIAEPGITGGSYARALAYGAPDPTAQVPGEFNNFIYVGTQSGRVIVTRVAGGGPGSWTDITQTGPNGVTGPILSINANPRRGSRDAFVVTPTQVWYIPDSSVVGGWINVTGNLFNLRTNIFNEPNSSAVPPAGSLPFDVRSLTTLIADWRYAIPVTPGNPNSATFPILYVGANSGVYRSLDRGATWSFYPQSSTYTEPNSGAVVNIPNGGFLPSTWVTDLDLALGNVDPLTGLPVAQTGSPNMLVATTWGRGTWTIRLDDPLPQFRITDLSGPKVASLSTTNPSNTLRVRFDGPIDPTSFNPSDIVLTAPSGVVIPITGVSPIVNPNLPQSGDRRDLFEFNFPTQTEVGFYTIKIGEQIFDFAGRAMNQNANLVNGESDDAYTGYVFLNPPGNLQGNLFISMPQVTRAGDPTLVTISAIEGSSTGSTQAGNPLTSFNKLISITTTDGQAIIPSSYTFDSTNDRGSKVFSFEFRTAGDQFVSVVDTSGTINPAKAQILVRGGQATSYVVNGFTNPTTAGDVGSITVTAKDSFGNIADGYTGTVNFTSTDSLATLPANSTFTATDNGVRSFNNVVLRSAGVRSIIATDTAKASVTGSQVGIVVNPAAVSQFSVAGLPATITAGTPSTITVTAQDKFGNTNPSYQGTVSFSSSDPQLAVGNGLPTSYTFQPTDNGLATFTNGVTLKTVGSRTVSAVDTVTPSITGTSNPATNVVAAAASGFTISVSPANPIAGTSFVMIVTAVDPFGNKDTKFTGAVTFSSTDTNSTLPGNYTFVSSDNGSKTFTGVILRTVNSLAGQTITAKDPNTGTPSGTSPTINVQPNVATQLFITNLPANSQAGVPTSFTVVAKDAFGNTATSYKGSVQFTVDDPLISISKYTFDVTDNGLKVLPVTFQSFGLKTITATDFNSPSLTSKATTFVSAGTFAKLSISNLAPTVVAGTQPQFRLTAQDKFGNQVTNYAGTVTFSTSDQLVNTSNGLPGAYTFTAGDNGTALFTTVFRTASTQSISASDTMAGVVGTPATTNVTAAAVNFFNVSGFPSPLIAGKSGSVKVVAVDVFGNTVTNYTGKVSFSSSDPVATLPLISTFSAADQGVRSFTVGLSTPGLQSISVTDTVQTAVRGSQQAIEVQSNVPPTLPPTGGTIGGLVFNDLNNNGVRDTNEPGIGGVTVYLDTNRDNTLNAGEITATTSVQGFFNLTSSVDVTAPVRAVTPTGQVQSTTNPPDTVLTNGVVASGLVFGFRASGGTSPPPVTPPVVPPPVVPPVTPPIVGDARSPGSNFAVGTSGSAGGTVSVKNQTGVTLRDFIPYAQTSEGGARPAVQRTPQGDRTIVGPGPGGVPDVLVFDNNGGNLTRTLTPFESSFTGGVFVTTGDISNDGYDDIVVSADVGGGPRVQVLNGKTFEVIADFFGIDDPDFRGGARTSLGDFNGDGILDLAVAAGFGGGPRIAIFDGRSLVPGQLQQRMVSDFFVFEQTLRNGVYLSAGDVSGDGKADLVLGGGPGGGPRVQIFSGSDLLTGKFTEVANFFAGNQDNRGGVRVSVKDLDGDQFMDLVVGDGEGAGSQVTAYPGKTLGSNRPNNPLFQFDELSGYTGGVFVG